MKLVDLQSASIEELLAQSEEHGKLSNHFVAYGNSKLTPEVQEEVVNALQVLYPLLGNEPGYIAIMITFHQLMMATTKQIAESKIAAQAAADPDVVASDAAPEPERAPAVKPKPRARRKPKPKAE